MPKKIPSYNTPPSFKIRLEHFLIIVICLISIIGSGIYLYRQFFFASFTPDINEVTQIPLEVKKVEDKMSSNPLLITSPENPLGAYLLRPVNIPINTHFRIPILLYHYVEYVTDRGDTIRISLSITPDTFERQVKTLKGAGYTFITPSEIPDLFEGKKTLPQKPVILSFDDGYRDFYTDVFPILKKYQVRVIAYVVPGFLDKHNNLTRPQLREITSSHLVEIGAHTVYHTYLKGANEKRVTFEVNESKASLERELNIKIVSFAYPYGAFDLNTIQAVKRAGFQTAASTIPGVDVNIDNLFFLYRLRPGGRVDQSLLKFLEEAK